MACCELLFAEDDPTLRSLYVTKFSLFGYTIRTAEDGEQTVREILTHAPDLLLCDLNMPKMSGFEFLSVVRRRFPDISVIASSGAYASSAVPTGVLADAFYAKGEDQPETLINMVAALIQTSAAQATAHQDETAPVWIPRNGKDSNGIPYIVITCTECLRSFPLDVAREENAEVLETACLFCSSTVKYIIDFSLSVTSPPKGPPSIRIRAGAA